MTPARGLLLMAMALAAAILPASVEASGTLGDCPMPPELGPIRGHVLVRATANEKGQLLFVKSLYSTLEPPKTRKKVFASLKKCLKAKHFSQAVVDVDYVIRTEFLLAYHYFEPVSDDAPRIPISDGRKVPRRWLEEMREEKIRLAERLLAKSKRRELVGDGWILRTDVSSEHVASIESGLRVAEKAFNLAFPDAPPVPEDLPVTIVVLSDADKLNRVAAFDNVYQAMGRLGGEYSPRDRMIYTYAGSDTPPVVVAGIIAHEATHHFVAQRLYAGERSPPVWVTEGIAVLIQCLDSGLPGDLDLSMFRRGKMFKGIWRWKAPAESFIDTLETSQRRHDLKHLGILLSGEGTMDADLGYATSWLLVHFMMNADEGAHRAAFTQWMASPEGEDGDAVSLAPVLGLSLEELEQAVRAWLAAIT